MLGYHTPECTRVRSAYGFALIENRGASVKQRTVDDVGMTDSPSKIRGSPVDITGVGVIDVLHAPLERHGMAAVVPHHPLGYTRSARSVENIERIGCLHLYAWHRGNPLQGILPVDVPSGNKLSLCLRPLKDYAFLGLMGRQLDRPVQKRLVGYHPFRLNAAGPGNDHLWFCIIDPH